MVKKRSEYPIIIQPMLPIFLKIVNESYLLLQIVTLRSFHCMLGEALRSVSSEDSLDDNTIFTIADQINHNLGVLKQSSPSMRLEVASLNHKAGLAAMSRSDYDTASAYLKVSLQLLPDDHWQSNYCLSLDSYMATAKVACSSGDMDKSESALKSVFKEATSLEDKVEAYYLYVNLLHSQERGEEAHLTCEDILSQLGENIPDHVSPEESKKLIQETIMLVSGLSEEKLTELKEADVNSQTIMRFLCLLGSISYFSKPEVSNCQLLGIVVSVRVSHIMIDCSFLLISISGRYSLQWNMACANIH